MIITVQASLDMVDAMSLSMVETVAAVPMAIGTCLGEPLEAGEKVDGTTMEGMKTRTKIEVLRIVGGVDLEVHHVVDTERGEM